MTEEIPVSDNLDDVDVMNGPVHLVGEEDDEAACGAGDSPVVAFYWRKVTCPDCLQRIERAEAARKAAEDQGPYFITMDIRPPVPPYGSAERGRWNADHPDDDRAQVPGSGGDR